jgi:hypothetical protein
MDGPIGNDETNYTFAPANFSDAEVPGGAIFDIIGNGSATPYSDGVNGVLESQINEIKSKGAAAPTLPSGWKKRLKEFISSKNNDLLAFLNAPVSSHPTLGKGDAILRRYGTIKHSPATLFKDVIMQDVSGVDPIDDINNHIISLKKGTAVEDYVRSVHYIYDTYRQFGETALRCEAALKDKLEVLDKVQGKLSGIVDLDPLDAYCPLMEASEAYLGKMYEKHCIEEEYKGFIAAYRKFLALRDIVVLTRTMESCEHEPICMICLSDSVSYALTPCGHTFCSTCIKKQYSACFLCRGTIRDRVKIYFG